jgi:metal-responsive CopG/Arc/MetJ family transcriptional regulator
MPADKVTIKIPRSLYNSVKQVIEGSGFSSPTEFIVYVLRDLVGEKVASKPAPSQEGGFTEEEVQAIRKRLQSLGYL